MVEGWVHPQTAVEGGKRKYATSLQDLVKEDYYSRKRFPSSHYCLHTPQILCSIDVGMSKNTNNCALTGRKVVTDGDSEGSDLWREVSNSSLEVG